MKLLKYGRNINKHTNINYNSNNTSNYDNTNRNFHIEFKIKPKQNQYSHSKSSNDKRETPYFSNSYFLTKTEASFFNILLNILKDYNLHVFSKVRIIDILSVYNLHYNYKWFNKIRAKHVDFLICDNKYFKPIMIIELDDPSHEKIERIERDKFVDTAFNDAKLPIIHIKAQYNYDIKELNDLLDRILLPYKDAACTTNIKN